MNIQTQIETAQIIYAKELVKLLFPNDSWLMKSVSHDAYVKGKSVQIDQFSGKPKSRKNKVNLKIDAVRRTLTKKSYDISEFATDPEAIVFTEAMLSNPQLRSATMEAHKETLQEDVAMDLKSQWAATEAERIIRTTGTTNVAAGATGATGTRKSVTYVDFLNAWNQLNTDKVPLVGRQVLVPVTILPQLFQIEEFIKYDFISDRNGMPIKSGVIGNILGMEVWVDLDDFPVQYDDTATPVPEVLVPDDDGTAGGVTYAGAIDNNLSIMVWHEKFVTRAKGKAEVFIQLKHPEYQSDIMSTNCIAGGSKLRKDNRGVVNIVETLVTT